MPLRHTAAARRAPSPSSGARLGVHRRLQHEARQQGAGERAQRRAGHAASAPSVPYRNRRAVRDRLRNVGAEHLDHDSSRSGVRAPDRARSLYTTASPTRATARPCPCAPTRAARPARAGVAPRAHVDHSRRSGRLGELGRKRFAFGRRNAATEARRSAAPPRARRLERDESSARSSASAPRAGSPRWPWRSHGTCTSKSSGRRFRLRSRFANIVIRRDLRRRASAPARPRTDAPRPQPSAGEIAAR